jgi:hypothetical protein
MKQEVILFYDDFSAFSIGEFPYDRDHSAMGEYQLVSQEGYAGQWVDQVCNYNYNGTGPTWIITSDGTRHYMEQMRIEKNRPHRMFPTLQTGLIQWQDYTCEATLKRLSTKGVAGLAFCMKNSINTLVLQLEKGKISLVHRHKEEIYNLAEAVFENDCDTWYHLRVMCKDDKVSCFVNDKEVIIFHSAELVARGGKVGITADCPTQFASVKVTTDTNGYERIQSQIKCEQEKEEEVQSHYPKMELWKSINLEQFGSSRQLRFGHLTGTKEWHIVLAQAQKRVSRDAYPHLSCLTAIDLNGKVLWQWGESSEQTEKLGKISADLPFQVYDIDGDGKDEVICGINFEILILEGATGVVKKRVKTPLSDDNDESLIGVPFDSYAFDRINPDGIRIANFSGKKRPSDILIKDRYCRIYALDSDLNLLWYFKSPLNTGHYPLAIDINGDGHDELLCGYILLDCKGKPIWNYPIEEDHTDEIVAGKFMARSDKGYFACVSGTEGFFIGDFQGNIVMRDKIGHAQRVSVGNYCPEREGFELVVSNFWGHQGVIYFYDCFGNPLWEMENEQNGNVLVPVNWKGDGSDLFMMNANPHKGGLYNGSGIAAVVFPDDGHPQMCCEAIDLCGDSRDEIVVWDYQQLYIYTQEDEQDKNQYQPVKYLHCNASNYRGEYSFPDASYITFAEGLR